jgi:hypothetical protein
MSDKPVARKAGRYYLKVAMQDFEGEEISAAVPAFVWEPKKPVVAVDLDFLPGDGHVECDEAAAALQKIAETANIFYLTRRSRRTQEQAHMKLTAAGYPDGPVLLWQRERWHIVRGGRFNLPRVIVEKRLVSQLPKLVEDFPGFRYGICNAELAAKAFVDAGVPVIAVGSAWMSGSRITHRRTWADLAEQGLP